MIFLPMAFREAKKSTTQANLFFFCSRVGSLSRSLSLYPLTLCLLSLSLSVCHSLSLSLSLPVSCPTSSTSEVQIFFYYLIFFLFEKAKSKAAAVRFSSISISSVRLSFFPSFPLSFFVWSRRGFFRLCLSLSLSHSAQTHPLSALGGQGLSIYLETLGTLSNFTIILSLCLS
jgi:hypothetical protein